MKSQAFTLKFIDENGTPGFAGWVFGRDDMGWIAWADDTLRLPKRYSSKDEALMALRHDKICRESFPECRREPNEDSSLLRPTL